VKGKPSILKKNDALNKGGHQAFQPVDSGDNQGEEEEKKE